MKLKNGLGHSQASSIMPLKSCFCSTFALPMVRRSVNTRWITSPDCLPRRRWEISKFIRWQSDSDSFLFPGEILSRLFDSLVEPCQTLRPRDLQSEYSEYPHQLAISTLIKIYVHEITTPSKQYQPYCMPNQPTLVLIPVYWDCRELTSAGVSAVNAVTCNRIAYH